MNPLRIELFPIRPAVRCDAPTLLDVLLKISSPEPVATNPRPRLNLGLVLDRSGSMSGDRKIDYARAAAAFAVEQLLATDRVSLTVFDDEIETLFSNGEVADKSRLLASIAGITPRGSTDLHGGWAVGAKQTQANLVVEGLNRVLLLSDGQANVGVVETDPIATAVNRAARAGVSTTTLGLGDDYNEDLLETMARSGDGNYYYIEHPSQLPTLFGAELMGLAASFGTAATLAVESPNGTAVIDVLNNFAQDQDGRWQLPNLIAGMPVYALVRLHVPAVTGSGEVCQFQIECLPTNATERQRFTATLSLPGVTSSAYELLAPDLEVHERVVLFLIARLKTEASAAFHSGDKAGALAKIVEAKSLLATAPPTDEVRREAEAIALLEAFMAENDESKFHKHAKYQSYQRSTSRS